MKPSHKDLICLAGALVALGILYGCDHLDDEDLSSLGSLLAISSVSPSALQSDVSPSTDPNTMASTPPADDKVTFGLTNSSQSGSGNDFAVSSFDIVCEDGSLDATNQPTAAIILAGATENVEVTVATGTFKEMNMATLLATGSDFCRVTFHGETLSGDPISSNVGLFGVTFQDQP